MAKTSFKLKGATAMPMMPKMGPMRNPTHQSVSIEKIANGFLARHSVRDGKGNYQDHTVYHPKRPKFVLATKPPTGV